MLKSQQQQKKKFAIESSHHSEDTLIMSNKQEDLGFHSKGSLLYTAPPTMEMVSLGATATQPGGAGEQEVEDSAA